jgi:DNA-binding IclR family transcriptional regulator
MEWMDRFVEIMNIVSAEHQHGIGVTMLANDTGLSKGTLHRILQNMVKYELIVQQAESKKYYLGPLSMIWGSRFVKGKDISQLLSGYCDEIAEKSRMYAYLCRFVTNEVYCIYTHQPEQERKTYFVHVGQRMPIHCAAAAKAVLAFQPTEKVRYLLEQTPRNSYTENTCMNVSEIMAELDTVRDKRIAWCREEMENGVSAMSIPLFADGATAFFSLSLVGTTAELNDNQAKVEEMLLLEGQKINEQLSGINAFSPIAR